MSSIDYRLLMTMGDSSFYHPTGDPKIQEKIAEIWKNLTNNSTPKFEMITVAQGRMLPCPKAAKNVVEFHFDDLCKEPRSAADFQAIGERFHTVILRAVPRMSMRRRDWLRRFILLIDTLYYMHRNVVVEADSALEDLFD